MTSTPIRIAVDIGGTFTDLELFDARTGRSHAFKTPTTPEDPSIGLMTAIEGAAARFGFRKAEVGLLIHGTTIATNAVLTRDLPKGAAVATQGFEDVLEIGRHARRDVYGLKPETRTVLVPRVRRFGVVERIGPQGEILTPIDPASIDDAVDAVVASGASVVAVYLLNAFANPEHEIAVARRFAERAPGIAVSCSHQISPEIREFERASTTALNALLIPVVKRYVDALRARWRSASMSAPIYLVQSNGGATTPQAAAVAPARLLLSGPSGGALAAERLAERLGIPDVVAVDMGGTSYDVSVIRDAKRSIAMQGEIEGAPVRLPMVEMRTIGAGGGSIVHVDSSGRLQVGPRSAGATPGPVCYGRGGVEPTVTDVNVILGRLDPANFLGGALAIDVAAARAAFENKVAVPLGLDAVRVAEGVLAVLGAKLAAAIKLSLFERGLDPADFALMSFGGAGGLHAIEVAEELGMRRVIFPRDPSTFSAHGILQSDIVHDLARTKLIRLDAADAPDAVSSVAGALIQEGEARLSQDGLPAGARDMALSADLRYRGQAFELTLGFSAAEISRAGLDALAERFHGAHLRRFSFDDRGEAVELVTLRLSAIGRLDRPAAGEIAQLPPPVPRGSRRVRLGGAWTEAPVYAQASLGNGASLAGPAVIEQPYTTLIVTAGWRVAAAATGDLVATREDA